MWQYIPNVVPVRTQTAEAIDIPIGVVIMIPSGVVK